MLNIISKSFVYLNKLFFLIPVFFLIAIQGFADSNPEVLLRSMKLEEKIGQLFVIPACQLRGDDHWADLEKIVSEGRAGGILFKQGTAQGQRDLINKLQSISPTPLLCIQDGEWGVAMRLTDVLSFPRNLTLGAIEDLSLLYAFGQEVGRQCNLVGAHIDLAPVADVNCNPLNPIIQNRAFGEDPEEVARRGEIVMRGIQSMGVMACAKHFPGHGDTDIDSHVDLPFIKGDIERLEKIELFPFRRLIQSGVKTVMSGHLCAAALDDHPFWPATFSYAIVTELLKNQLGFSGLVISDALNMQALSKNFTHEQIAINTVLAGHDLLLYSDHVAPNIDQILHDDLPVAFSAIQEAVEKGVITEEMIDERVLKILKAKEQLGLFQNRFLGPLMEIINSEEAHALKKRLFEEAITLVRNEGSLPLQPGSITLIEQGNSPFFKQALQESREVVAIDMNDPDLMEKIQSCPCAVLALTNLRAVSPHFGLESSEEDILYALADSGIPIVAIVFGSPYSIAKIPLYSSIVAAYENQKEAQEAAADVVLGYLFPKGRLPVSVSSHFPVGTGLSYGCNL